VVSNRLNEVVLKLSSWAAIVLVPTLIAGIYGMNFDHMPELKWQYGYPACLFVMAVAGVVLHRILRRAGWL
jgi:magnesium transporter